MRSGLRPFATISCPGLFGERVKRSGPIGTIALGAGLNVRTPAPLNETPSPHATKRSLATIVPRELLAYGIKGANILASLGFMVLLARLAGAETVGHYNLAFATAAVVMTLALGGLDRRPFPAICARGSPARRARPCGSSPAMSPCGRPCWAR